MINPNAGRIKVYIGPMWARKTSSMSDDVERFYIAKKRCIIVKYINDVRYDHLSVVGSVVTHAKREYEQLETVVTHKLADILDTLLHYDVIGVDEAQFYPDVVDILQLLANMGKIIFCAALDADFMAQPFRDIPRLIAIAEEVVKLHAVCKCGALASYTSRLTDDTDVEKIGGSDMYASLCRSCMWPRDTPAPKLVSDD